MPPPRKRTSPPANLAEKQPANAAPDLDTLRDEVAAETQGDEGIGAVPLGDSVVRIKDFMQWPTSANEDYAYGRFTRWAQKVLVEGDYQVWAGMNGGTGPTNGEVVDFIRVAQEVTGFPLENLLTSLSM
jgi:hypothetical protein